MPEKDVSTLIQELPRASLTRLRELWQEHIGHVPASTLTPALMRPVLAYRIQELAHGRPQASTVRQLAAVLKGLDPKNRERNEARGRFQTGSRILREWQGRTHEVTLTCAGYEYAGKTYTSLSPIANLITGTRWSGPAFFGTRKGDAR